MSVFVFSIHIISYCIISKSQDYGDVSARNTTVEFDSMQKLKITKLISPGKEKCYLLAFESVNGIDSSKYSGLYAAELGVPDFFPSWMKSCCVFFSQETVEYFNSGGRRPLTLDDKLEFINFWYLLIIFNDFLTIAGCVVKILIENKVCRLFRLYFWKICAHLPSISALICCLQLIRSLFV